MVGAMATDTWAAVRDAAARVLGRGSSEREAEVITRLDASHGEVHRASPEALASVSAVEEARWSSRFEVLLEEHPSQADQLRSLLSRIEQVLQRDLSAGLTTQHIAAERDAYVAGRDQFIDLRSRDGRDARDNG